MLPCSPAARTLPLAGAAVVALAAIGFAHGGTYRGPGDNIAPGTGMRLPDEAALADWSYWWELNREPFLDLDAVARRPSEEQIRAKIVPSLLRVLENETETDNDVVTGCLIALAKIGDGKDPVEGQRFAQAIRTHLKSAVQEIAETAALALGILGHDGSVDTLAALLRDSAEGRAMVAVPLRGEREVSLRTRAFAAYGLGLIGAQTADEGMRSAILALLVGALESDRSTRPDVPVACLIALGLVPLERIRPATPPEEDERPPPEDSRVGQLEYLLAGFANHDRHVLVRAHIPCALVRLLDRLPPEEHDLYKPRVAALLLAGCEKESVEPVEIVQSCVLALGQLGDDDTDELDASIRAALMRATEELDDQQARSFSLIALAQAGGRAGQGARGEIDAVAMHLVENLHGASALRPWAALASGVYGRALLDRGIPVPAELASSVRAQLVAAGHAEQIGACAVAAGLLGDHGSQENLLKRLAQKQGNARGYVALALGLLHSPEAAEALRLTALDSMRNSETLRQAALGLGALGDSSAVPDLLRMLQESQALSSLAGLASALGAIGDSGSLEPLVAMLLDEDTYPPARGFAAVALGIMADREGLTWHSRFAAGLNYRASTPTLNDQEGTGILNIL